LDARLARLEERAEETAAQIAGTGDLDARLGRLEQRADETATQIAGTRDLDVRLGRLEQRADETATQIAGTQNMDVRLARLEERADETATQIAGTRDLDVRLGRLEQRADETATHMAGDQKQSLEHTERIAAQLAGLEQNLMELSDRLSLIKQTIDGATSREQDTHNSIEAVSSRVINTQQRVEELFPRQALGEKALKDLGTLISFFVKRLKRVNASSTEIAMRLGDLESHFRSKVGQLEERHSSIIERKDGLATQRYLLQQTSTAEMLRVSNRQPHQAKNRRKKRSLRRKAALTIAGPTSMQRDSFSPRADVSIRHAKMA
jgi:chromosome segregation ATPase